jgi:hypothetical protein
MKIKNIYSGILASMLCLTFVGCDDNIDPIVDQLKTDRPFTPTNVTTTNGQTQATIRWNPSLTGEGVMYTVEVSKNLTFDVIEHTLSTTDVEATVTNEDIDIKQDHYARVRADGEEGGEDSGWSVSEAFRITGEQIFLSVREEDLTFNSVYLRWTVAGDVTKITLTPDGGSSTDYVTSAGEESAGAKTITGLTFGTEYTAEIFNGETSRGTVTFTTLSLDIPDADLVISLNGTESFTQNTFDTLTKARVVFVLPQGSVFSASTAMILKGSTDIAFYGVPGSNKAIMAFNGLTLPATGGKILFENVDLTGIEYAAGVPTANPKRAYIFNQSVASVTSEIAFENCIIRNFANTPVRIQSANTITINDIKVNNCIVYDISASQTYAFINTNVATGKVNNISITNSTFYNLRIGLILHNAAASQSVTVSNCTINDISDNTRALIDYNAQTAGSFTFTANILAKTKTTDNTARGIRISGAGVSVAASTYMASDYTTANNPIGGVTAYAGTNTDLFVDPANGNFNFKDTNFAGKNTSGDPRWRP